MPTVHLIIKGKVQGVFYRAMAKKIAQSLALSGWVKNTEEGNVEAIACGSEENVDAFIQWCKKGPANAIVSSVEFKMIEDIDFNGFSILRD